MTIASPKGGAAPIDPKSTGPDFSTDAVKKFFNDSQAVRLLNDTVVLKDIDPGEFDAVFYPGGNGPMWELPNSNESIRLIENFHREGKVVALLCHAPAALEHVKGADGKPLINGIKGHLIPTARIRPAKIRKMYPTRWKTC